MTQPTKLSVKDWSPDDQPREKLLLKGVSALSDAELLAIILGSGSREESVVELAQRILQSAGNRLHQLGKYSIQELMKFKGVGEAKAISIVATLELGKRRKSEEILEREQIRCSKDVYQYFHPSLCDLYYEEFWAVFLNCANKVISKTKISQGGVSTTSVDNRIICREAINHLAHSVILCHNHPSGNPSPSKADDVVTYGIKQALALFEIEVRDHIVLCDGSYYSYADEGRI
ncbi:MAG: DNA repair protein RadC [Dysgonamonadaceae bacterium]|jgi:DNA repair protein RadC|nr:DNA repair protein RadC [Dysgonamonadaceae bacterium]